jgi:hypothetical protein
MHAPLFDLPPALELAVAVFALGEHEWILAVEARKRTGSSVDQLIAGLP